MDIRVENAEKIARELGATERQLKRAAKRAVRKTTRAARTRISKSIRDEVTLKKQYVDARLKLDLVNTDDAFPLGTVTAKRRGLLINRYAHRQITRRGKPAGFRVRISKGQKAAVFRHAFEIRLRRGTEDGAGTTGLAVRTRHGKGSGRYPIEVLHGPSPSQIFETVKPHLSPEIAERLQKTYLQELNFELIRSGGNG